MISEQYVEAIATLRAPADATRVAQWLSARSLRSQRIQVGLLVQGDRHAFEAAFGISLQQTHLPLSLPIPPELHGAVTTITIPSPRRYH
ncbi:MAG: hypothetical protein U0232_26710 [Thermomicrobiales bacterium]